MLSGTKACIASKNAHGMLSLELPLAQKNGGIGHSKQCPAALPISNLLRSDPI